jgi:S1-C subfamily serine protease
MPFLFFRRIIMAERKWIFGALVGIALLGVVSGFLLYHQQSENSMSDQMGENTPALELGIIYLPVNQMTAAYFDLTVNNGALVTQVVKGGLVDQAGIKAGDVIMSFNGIGIGEATPLLGMMRSCPIGHGIILGVWSDGNTREVTIIHPGQ